MNPTYEELERQLEESRREFRAADATIHNLELKLTDMTVQLANAESKCMELAAENSNKSCCLGFFASVIKSGEEWTSVCEHEYSEAFKTPVTDAFLAEVRAQGVDAARNALIKFVEDEVGPNTNVPGLIRGAEVCVSIDAQLRKGAAL